MGTIVDTAIAVGTNAEPFLTSNPGFTAEELAPPFGITHLRVTNTGGVNTVYNNTAEHSYLYLSTATPADRNQSVTIRVKRRTHGGGTYWWAVARFSSGNFVYISFTGDANKRITIGKRVGGTSTDLGSSENNARLAADGAEGDLTLEITGTAPTISLRALWNGVQVIAPVTITDAALDAVGRVGFAQRTFAGDSPSTRYHLARFTAIDGVGGGGTDGTATGVTITAAGSFIPGSASGQAGATAAGVTITAAGSFIPGSASGVINGTLNFQAAGMEFGSRSGLGIDTFGLDAGESYRYTIHADGLTLGSALHTSSAVTLDSAGKLANYVGSAVAPGSTYRIVAIRQADGEAATFRMVAS